MDDIVAERAQFIVDKLKSVPSNARLLVAIAGVPASGKSSFASRLVQEINSLAENAQNRDQAVLVGLDGWHLTRAQLDAMGDPKLAHDRRGIHWTFDAHSYVSFVERLRQPLPEDASIITAPSFDHALKDPTPDAVFIHSHNRIVVIEGLYTMLNIEPWCQAAASMDERWWVQIDSGKAKERLVKRHVQTGVAKDMDEAVWRAENNDEDNGKYILENQFQLTHAILSIDDIAYATSEV
ncbi:P-loop containing nucleoside triphosphate hydrolase protein [Melanogaster broomeanus]|nr:P-loop containing nucleoside triphosphate hydrolase protein [Melanogaster broomeanus]